MREPTGDRLARLLALLAYLKERHAVPVSEVAAHFGVSEARVLADVNLLWVSGTPGYYPDDLIDFSYDAYSERLLTLTDDRGMARPLRLSAGEAVALLAALNALAADPDLPGGAIVVSAREKLRAAAGEAAADAAAVDIRIGPTPGGDRIAALRDAIRRGRVVRLEYVSGRDEVSERDVDPVEVFTDGARWFLRAWCHRAREPRTFRLDRVLGQAVTDAPADPHPELEGPAAAEPDLGAADPVATLELAPAARWVAEGLPADEVLDLPDGWTRVVLRVADAAWLRSLVLGLGEAVRSVEPASLAAELAEVAGAALAEYERLA